MMMKYITIALAKGRLAELSIDLFESIGLDCHEIKEKSRKLIFTDEKNKIKFVMVKASDVPTYVEYGAADIGIVGKDTLMEEGRNLYEMINLKFGACKIVVAGPQKLKDGLNQLNHKRIATKYPNIAKDYFQNKKGQTIEVIKLNGSVELAPLVGLSDVIVDIVESGRTLKENGLVIIEEICEVSARFIVNRISMKIEKARILDMVQKINEKLQEELV